MTTSSNTSWERPSSVPYPSIWRHYVGKIKMADGKLPKFKIQDVPDDLHEDLIDFMTTNFLRDEYLCSSQDILHDPTSLKEFITLWRKTLKQRVVIVALVDEEGTGGRPRIAGANMTGVTLKTDKFSQDMFEGEGTKRLIKFSYEIPMSFLDVFEKYGVEEYMSALGLCVHPHFRGQGLGREILAARYDICKAVGLKATVTLFTPTAAQKAAADVGMEVLAEVFYDDCIEDGKMVFQNKRNESMKLMGCAI